MHCFYLSRAASSSLPLFFHRTSFPSLLLFLLFLLCLLYIFHLILLQSRMKSGFRKHLPLHHLPESLISCFHYHHAYPLPTARTVDIFHESELVVPIGLISLVLIHEHILALVYHIEPVIERTRQIPQFLVHKSLTSDYLLAVFTN